MCQGGIEGTFLSAAGADKKMDLGMPLDVERALAEFDVIDTDCNDFVTFEELYLEVAKFVLVCVLVFVLVRVRTRKTQMVS